MIGLFNAASNALLPNLLIVFPLPPLEARSMPQQFQWNEHASTVSLTGRDSRCIEASVSAVDI